jgi:hypothetical protein
MHANAVTEIEPDRPTEKLISKSNVNNHHHHQWLYSHYKDLGRLTAEVS